jgi:hypothetical protein
MAKRLDNRFCVVCKKRFKQGLRQSYPKDIGWCDEHLDYYPKEKK